MSNSKLRTRLIAALAVVMLAAGAARLLPGPRTIDDAFITFRYSRNLVEGHGFVYNAGVHTLGTTTPLFTLLMAAISFITGRSDFPTYALVVSALADSGTAALLLLLAQRLTGSNLAGFALGLLWAVAPRSVTFAVGGMETSVIILWMALAVWSYVNQHERLLGLFAGLGLLTRVDAALWVGLLLLAQLIERWRSTQRLSASSLPWSTWLMAGLVILPWLVFATGYFGSPLPNSLSAKSVAYTLPPGAAFGTFLTAYSTPFLEYETIGTGAMVTGVIYLALSLFGIAYAARRLPRAVPFLLYPWLYLFVFSLANPLVFRWYLAPPMPALMLSLIIGAWSLFSAFGRTMHMRRFPVVGLASVVSVWLAFSLNAWTLHPDHGSDRPAPLMAWHKIELLYEAVGRRLRDEFGVTAETRVASADIGAIGYFSGATIIDTVGLVTPELTRYYPVPSELVPAGQNYAIPPQLILDTQPEYLVTMEAFVRLGLEQSPVFQTHYELIHETPTDFYGTGMRVYRRVDRPASEATGANSHYRDSAAFALHLSQSQQRYAEARS